MKNMINTNLILNYLKANILTKTQFCKLCKITFSTLNKVLNDKQNLKMKTLFKIARQLNIKISDLFKK